MRPLKKYLTGLNNEDRNQAIHAGFDDDPTTRAVAAPIYQTTSYSFRDTQHGADLFNLAEAGNIIPEL